MNQCVAVIVITSSDLVKFINRLEKTLITLVNRDAAGKSRNAIDM